MLLYICSSDIVSWKKYPTEYCPEEYKYDNSYKSLLDAKDACVADRTCGYVYDYKCNSGPTTHNFGLCKHFSSGELMHNNPDCVYEKIRPCKFYVFEINTSYKSNI